MKYSNLLFIALLMMCFSACQKDASLETTLTQDDIIKTRKYETPCNDPQPTDLDGLADIGGCYSPEWSGGELEKYINGCLIGGVAMCQNFTGFEIIDNVSSEPIILSFYDLNFDGVYSTQEQLNIITDIMNMVDDLQPSCASATLVSVDLYRDALLNGAMWMCVKYICCGKNKEF